MSIDESNTGAQVKAGLGIGATATMKTSIGNLNFSITALMP